MFQNVQYEDLGQESNKINDTVDILKNVSFEIKKGGILKWKRNLNNI